MAQTFKASVLRASWLMQVVSVNSVGGGTISSTVKHQMFMLPSVVPPSGTDATAILVKQRNGADIALNTWLQNYTFDVVRPRYRIAGSSSGDINFGSVTIDHLAEGSDVATFITAYALTTTGWVQAAGSNIYSNQLITTFRSQSGRIAKLVYNNGITNPGRPVRPPTADTGIQGYFNAIVSGTSCVRGRDGSPMVAAVGWFAGQNERLWRDIGR